jgi:hypothetical protein
MSTVSFLAHFRRCSSANAIIWCRGYAAFVCPGHTACRWLGGLALMAGLVGLGFGLIMA